MDDKNCTFLLICEKFSDLPGPHLDTGEVLVDLYNSTPKKTLVFCLVSVTVKFRVRVSVGFRKKDSRFYWGRKVKNDDLLGGWK